MPLQPIFASANIPRMVGLTVRDVTKRFGRLAAVDNVSLEVAPGELFFILGPSGCGKTTLLRLIAGFYEPDAGSILFGGKDVTFLPPEKRNTGMVFQNYALWPHMNVSQNVSFGLEMHRVPKPERSRRVAEALAMVQMSDYAGHLPSQLSGGQQQRIALARALVFEPDIVLFDEPLSNLDARLRIEMRHQIRRLHDNLGLTMIYVTHDQTEALTMADRVAVMQSGRVSQVGTPRELYDRPANIFIAGFIGEANMLSGRSSRLKNTVTVRTAAGELKSTVFDSDIGSDAAVHCCIRPESLRIADSPAPDDNIITAS
ncbi:MAG TPA: ABC transporter ATP-binding protein, partial [Sedimentisphaerales bacterium]|nr:ABC transporter ATP-binding protein [Sedimentisphaerales bacterium]